MVSPSFLNGISTLETTGATATDEVKRSARERPSKFV
jgi:hypothetical protein